MQTIVNIKLFFLIVFLIAIVGLTGCGMGIYNYEHISSSGESCRVSVWSLREIEGAGLGVDKNCRLSGEADTMKGNYDFIKALAAIAGAMK